MELSNHAYKIKELREKSQFADVLLYYKTHIATAFVPKQVKQNQWMVADIMFCLRKQEQSSEAIQFFAGYLKMKICDVENLRLKSELGWNLFALVRSGQKSPVADALSSAFLMILDPEKDQILFTALFWKLISNELEKMQPNLLMIYKALDRILPAKLSNNPQKFNTIIKGQQKEISLASDMQRWYIEKSKILFLTKKYAECIKIVDQGFEKINNFTPDMEFWLLRRKYHALAELGEYKAAISGLKELINKKTDWYLYKDLSEIYFKDGKNELALENACIAGILPGKTTYKVSLFAFMAENLLESEIAQMHTLIVCHIRQKNNWKIPAKDEEIFSQTHQIEECIKYSVEFWITNLLDRGVLLSGKIAKILHEGNKGDGFIEFGHAQSCYFKMHDIICDAKGVEEGTKVYFLKRISFFKGKTSEQAFGILLKDRQEKISGIAKLLVI